VAGLTLLSIGGVAAAATGPAPTSGERAVTSASPAPLTARSATRKAMRRP
jgi:hypothetical protein